MYVGNATFNIAASAEEWEGGEYHSTIQQIWRCAWGGATVAAAVHNQAVRHNHFTKDPPIEVQLERAIANFSSLMPVCAEYGVVLAWENHIDYRLAEIVQVVEAVDSPWLRINLDTANPIAVIEDPLEGARLAAKYAVNMHLKDMRLQPATGTGEPRVSWAPLGTRPCADRRDSGRGASRGAGSGNDAGMHRSGAAARPRSRRLGAGEY